NNACVPKGTAPDECTADACDTDGVTLLKCNNGTIETVDCSADNDQICSNNACVPKGTAPDECTADACDTDGVTLLKCNNGTIETVDCSANNDQICSNNACAPKTTEPPECDPKKEATCDGNTLVSCTPEGKEKLINCEDEKKICDPTAHECIAPIEGSAVGVPCSCSGDSCNTVITGKELNPTMGSYAKFNNSDQMIVPNFFGNASEISGCDALAAQIPEGMVLGCFRDSSLTANDGFISSAKSFMNTLKNNSWISSGVVNLADWGLKFIAKVEENVQLSVPNGYCFVGALDAHLVFSQSSGVINMALKNRGADLVKLANEKFDTGDIEKAKTATCPEGSVLINDIHKTTTIAGYGQDGSDKTAFSMAMCLKSCEADSDCRTEDGYSCVKWHEKNVCFYAATIDAIHELETSLDIK
ncbi:MAG: hypothetical protein J6A01_07680, partial [Proteobacteria bacterium]|nr:hypothetical protein [Pseudomonadota bacterium]